MAIVGVGGLILSTSPCTFCNDTLCGKEGRWGVASSNCCCAIVEPGSSTTLGPRSICASSRESYLRRPMLSPKARRSNLPTPKELTLCLAHGRLHGLLSLRCDNHIQYWWTLGGRKLGSGRRVPRYGRRSRHGIRIRKRVKFKNACSLLQLTSPET